MAFLIPVLRGKTPEQVCKEYNVDVALHTKLFALTTDEQIVCIYMADLSSANRVRDLPIEHKQIIISGYYGFDADWCLDIMEKCLQVGTRYYEACLEYQKYQMEDPIQAMLVALKQQAYDQARQISKLKINMGKMSEGEDKGVERYLKWQKATGEAADTIKKLEALTWSKEEAHIFDTMTAKHMSTFDKGRGK